MDSAIFGHGMGPNASIVKAAVRCTERMNPFGLRCDAVALVGVCVGVCCFMCGPVQVFAIEG